MNKLNADCVIKSGCANTERYYCSVVNKRIGWYSSFTKYNSIFSAAASKWHAKGNVTINSGTNLRVYDVNEVSNYAALTNTGSIKFNTYVMDSYTVVQQQSTALHELGHALALSHRDLDNSQSIMSTFGPRNNINIHSNDMIPYNCLWS